MPHTTSLTTFLPDAAPTGTHPLWRFSTPHYHDLASTADLEPTQALFEAGGIPYTVQLIPASSAHTH